jgi:Putative restriction endonuclease
VATIAQPISKLKITWPLLPDDFLLPDDPVENTDQPLIAAALRELLLDQPELIEDALVVSNFALCAGIGDRIICKAPDWMYLKPVQPWPHRYPRRSYTPHKEGGVPQVVMEFISANYGEEYSVEYRESVGKWFFYEQVIQVPYYTIFRPETGHIEVYALEAGKYQEQTADTAGRFWIPGLNLFLGVWHGTHSARTGYWLRWWNAQGELLLWPEERAEAERQRAETEHQRAETERQRAETEHQRAEAERQEKEQLQAALEQQQQRMQELLARCAALGIDPEE